MGCVFISDYMRLANIKKHHPMGVFTRFHCSMRHFFWGYWEIVINGLYDIDSFNLNTPCSFWDSLFKGWGYLARCKKRKKCLFSDLVGFFRTNHKFLLLTRGGWVFITSGFQLWPKKRGGVSWAGSYLAWKTYYLL